MNQKEKKGSVKLTKEAVEAKIQSLKEEAAQLTGRQNIESVMRLNKIKNQIKALNQWLEEKKDAETSKSEIESYNTSLNSIKNLDNNARTEIETLISIFPTIQADVRAETIRKHKVKMTNVGVGMIDKDNLQASELTVDLVMELVKTAAIGASNAAYDGNLSREAYEEAKRFQIESMASHFHIDENLYNNLENYNNYINSGDIKKAEELKQAMIAQMKEVLRSEINPVSKKKPKRKVVSPITELNAKHKYNSKSGLLEQLRSMTDSFKSRVETAIQKRLDESAKAILSEIDPKLLEEEM